jgi:hypothetical protein
MTPSRRALLAAGVTTLAVSLILSIAPALAAKGGNSDPGNGGGGNAGAIKITDVASGQQVDDSENDPHVCAFWVGFYASEPFESGTWQLLSWAPTGDGSAVASGTYDTSGDGLDATGTLSPVAGHYRFDWMATGSSNAKHKTLWVDDTCVTDEDPPAEDVTPPSEDETPPSDEETLPSDEETLPSDEETPPSQEETVPSDEETPPSEDATPPSQDETPSSEDATPPSDEETPPSQEETPPSQDETPPSQEETVPSDEETPPSDEETPQSEDATPPNDEEAPPSDATPPSDEETPESPDDAVPSEDEAAWGVLPGTGGPPPAEDVAPEAAVAAGGSSHLPDTAMPLASANPLAALGVLLLIAACAGIERRPLRG